MSNARFSVTQAPCLPILDALCLPSHRAFRSKADIFATTSLRVRKGTLRAVSGSSTWPQVFIGGKLIGNANDLEAHFGVREAA